MWWKRLADKATVAKESTKTLPAPAFAAMGVAFVATLLALWADVWVPVTTAVCGFALADLISGVAHWTLDRYVPATAPDLIGVVSADNRQHHAEPGACARHRWWETVSTTAPFVIVGGGLLLAVIEPGPFAVGLLLPLMLASEIHKLTHCPPESVPAAVRLAQAAGLLLPPEMHREHHRTFGAPTPTHYCVVSGWWNPVLDSTGVFGAAEALIAKHFGLHPAVPPPAPPPPTK